MKCSYNKVVGNDLGIHSIRLKCVKEHGHEGPHLDCSGEEWNSKPIKKAKLCSHNILIEDEHAMCELPAGHEGEHVSGGHKWIAKKDVRRNGTCFYCNSKRKLLTVDHLVPRSKGGTDFSHNFVSCCGTCNQDKDSLRLEEYALKNFKRFVVCCKKLGISCSDFLKQHLVQKEKEEVTS